MKSIRRFTLALSIGLTLAVVPGALAQNDDELRIQQDKQRQVQAETDLVVRRITTMLRVMQFYDIDSKAADKEIMKEMSETLAKLSKNQMTDVIRQLEAAGAAKTEKQSEEAMLK